MKRSNALERLSEYCGIVDTYTDARGVRQTVSAKTRQALLGAMGIRAVGAPSAGRALAELQAQRARQCIASVHVHYSSAGPLEIAVNCDGVEPPKGWRIELEGGGIERGPCVEGQSVLRIEGVLPDGYHTLIVEPSGARCSLIVTPGTCWLPPEAAAGKRLWGLATQLYLLRSERNWGIGDYGDLERLIPALAAQGASVVGLNPLHAMFSDDPEQASPYSPASRLLLNVLNIDVESLVDSMNCEAARAQIRIASFQVALARCRESALVDYSGVAALKLPVLRTLYDCSDRSADLWRHFLAFRSAAGAAFERGCLFLALRQRFATQTPALADWHSWPEAYQNPESPATVAFANEYADEVTFQAWLQFLADTQLRACCRASAGMAVGLYRDLAVGSSPGGAETWANPSAVVATAQVGAPPDLYNPQGQDWGLPPFNPQALRAEGYQSFIELLRANMRHAGGLRIDHVMALQQLYWVPRGHPPRDGAYVRYPLEDLVGILALESQRQRCLVVGEDLGTVPAGFRERMERANILSYRVLFFEKEAEAFIPPDAYPKLAVAVASSHDLPTLRAWWQATDLQLKRQLDLFPTEPQAALADTERDADRAALARLLQEQHLIGDGDVELEGFVVAAHSLLSQTRAVLAMLQIDDLTGEVDPVNVPGTSDEHPNWRRRLSVGLEQLGTDPRFLAATSAMSSGRALRHP